MSQRITLLLVVIATLNSTNQVAMASGVFELRLLTLENPQALNAKGTCCSGQPDTQRCQSPCRTFMRICLKQYQTVINTGPPCTFGSLLTPLLGNNSFSFPSSKSSFSNPVRLPFDFSWPGTFSLIIEAWHDRTVHGPTQDSPRELITQMATQSTLKVGHRWTSKEHSKSSIRLRFEYRAICDPYYYGSGCQVSCQPRDDALGHYGCTGNGTRTCHPGWRGEYCDKAQCLPGCDQKHGFCDKPNECKCRLGWQGTLCNKCILYPGCQMGTCSEPWQCKCNNGWGGLFCNQDLNYCTNHKPCKNGGLCKNAGQGSYECQCRAGFHGTNCEVEVDDCHHRPCLHGGTCTDMGTSYVCRCPSGWHGRHCESSATSCEDTPCKHGGTCVSVPLGSLQHSHTAYKCQCQPGYKGVNCEREEDECRPNPCKNNGRCVDELAGFRCICQPGYSGQNCQVNHNDCSLKPCLNGATCVDRINDFECRCVAGFVGPLCQENVDDCLNAPCANGGTCHDKVNDFRCDCAPGFTGKDCRYNIDECAARPCRHGGKCSDQVNDYECHCHPPFFGKNCQFSDFHSSVTPSPSPGSPSSSIVITGNATANPGVANEQSQEDSGLTLHQLLLIICLGIGIPIVLISIVIVVLLIQRRKLLKQDAAAARAQKDNEQNELQNNATTRNKKVLDAIPAGNNALKLTNEDRDKLYLERNILSAENSGNKPCNKDLNGIRNSCASQKHMALVDNDVERGVEEVGQGRLQNQILLTSRPTTTQHHHVSADLSLRQPSNHEVPPMHKPMQAKSRDLSLHLGVSSQPFRDLEAQYCRPLSDTYHLTYDSQFGESMLATEV